MNRRDLYRLDVRRLAADFSAAVRRVHTEQQLARIQSTGDAHLFYDANDIMAEAVTAQAGRGWNWSDYADDINAAWDRAREYNYKLSRVLVACEFSATVRDVFAAAGHDAMSCDVLPTENPAGKHYQGDVRDILSDGFDLMIAHPPCTYLANSGVKHLVKNGQRVNPERWQAMREGAEFFRDLGDAPIPRIARENPVMHCYAREIVGRRADQYIQPHQYGHDVSKKTGLWLDGLKPLTSDPAEHVAPRIVTYRGRKVKRWSNQSPCGADRTPPSDDRGHIRSRFFSGIARAFCAQWTGLAVPA